MVEARISEKSCCRYTPFPAFPRRPAVLRIPKEPLLYEISRHHEPRARIQPGDRLLVEAEDALSGQIRTPADRRDKSKVPYSNPVNGPIFVEGAEPGDA